MSRIKMGFYSGLVATLITGCMLLMKNALHVIPQLHVARSIADLLGTHDSVMPGVIVILAVGIFVFGGLFATYAEKIPVRTYLGKSFLCAVATWLVWMVVFMPLAGSGVFGLAGGMAVPVGALVLSLVYWLILGIGYRWLSAPVSQPDTGRVES